MSVGGQVGPGPEGLVTMNPQAPVSVRDPVWIENMVESNRKNYPRSLCGPPHTHTGECTIRALPHTSFGQQHQAKDALVLVDLIWPPTCIKYLDCVYTWMQQLSS